MLSSKGFWTYKHLIWKTMISMKGLRMVTPHGFCQVSSFSSKNVADSSLMLLVYCITCFAFPLKVQTHVKYMYLDSGMKRQSGLCRETVGILRTRSCVRDLLWLQDQDSRRLLGVLSSEESHSYSTIE